MERLRKKVIIDEAVTRAQQLVVESPLQIGSIVAHPDHPRALKLRGIEGDTAILLDLDPQTKGVTELRFPAGKLFDPNVAHQIAISIAKGQQLLQQINWAN
ncbi:hypothetical protein HYS96_03555 [Candidatus Daviesbacteria bacterium]|nr:hypothetical protein [Candidatus Daviesbacteria bacterium]